MTSIDWDALAPPDDSAAPLHPRAAKKAQEAQEAPAPRRVIALSSLSSQGAEEERKWPTLADAARYGLAGEVVAALEPHTEADPAGLLVTFLAAFGCYVGAGPHAIADGAQHPARLNVVLVGRTSRGRKGTVHANVARILEAADPYFAAERVFGGLASGEGLIAALEGDDQRALVFEPEYARVLKVSARDGSTLSAILRDAWDRGRLRVLTRKDPLKVDGAHVSVIGHITVEELTRHLSDTETLNGYANRFLHVAVRRSKRLPEGGNLTDRQLAALGEQVRSAAISARKITRLARTAAASQLWGSIYNGIDDDVDGVLGAVTARAEAQMLRLSVVYALLDGSAAIDVAHLEAAKAVWDYCEASAVYIWGDATGDPQADKLLSALREAGAAGIDGTAQAALFGRHVTAERLDTIRDLLERRGLVVTEQQPTAGRPRTVTRAKEHTA